MELHHDVQTNLIEFETAEMHGVMQAEEVYHGVCRLVHKASGFDVVHPQYSVLNLFRLFAQGLGMGQPRKQAREWRLLENGIEIHWPQNAEHHGEITARYEVGEPNVIDLTIQLKTAVTYRGYELFLSNYFNPTLRPHLWVQGNPYGATPDEPELIAPVDNAVYRSLGLVFPRDFYAGMKPVDGRWERRELGCPTARFVPLRYYAYPLAMQVDSRHNIAVGLMSRRDDCFAVTTGYDGPDLNDAWKGQNPLYLSLYGDDFLPGDARTVRARLVVAPVDEGFAAIRDAYEQFVNETGK